EDDQAITRELEGKIPEVVLPRAPDYERLGHSSRVPRFRADRTYVRPDAATLGPGQRPLRGLGGDVDREHANASRRDHLARRHRPGRRVGDQPDRAVAGRQDDSDAHVRALLVDCLSHGRPAWAPDVDMELACGTRGD